MIVYGDKGGWSKYAAHVAHIAFLIGKFLNVSNTVIDHQTNLRNDLAIDSIMKIELISYG